MTLSGQCPQISKVPLLQETEHIRQGRKRNVHREPGSSGQSHPPGYLDLGEGATGQQRLPRAEEKLAWGRKSWKDSAQQAQHSMRHHPGPGLWASTHQKQQAFFLWPPQVILNCHRAAVKVFPDPHIGPRHSWEWELGPPSPSQPVTNLLLVPDKSLQLPGPQVPEWR